MKRRDFLKGGTLLAACLVAGLRPTEPEPATHIGHKWSAIYGGMAGGGKTPHPDDTWTDFVRDLYASSYVGQQDFSKGGFLVPPQFAATLLESAETGAILQRRVPFPFKDVPSWC